MTSKTEVPWMEHVCYEPRPQTFEPAPGPSRGWRIFLILATLALVCGGLAGLA